LPVASERRQEVALTRGQLFRRRVRRDHELTPAEDLLLDEVAEVIDTIDALPPTQATERRLQRVLLSRLLGQLALPTDDGSPQVLSPASSRGKRAADIRWKRERDAS